MRIPLSWIHDYCTPKLAPRAIAELLSLGGVNVERLEERVIPNTVRVGKVLEVQAHPNADRLRVVKVSLGAKDIRTIVCGAPNVAAGQKVAVALPGTTLPNGQKISESSIRGVASAGMICAADELGVGDDHTGILVLPATAKEGALAAPLLGGDEVVFELEVTPNRADCLSVLGVAREIGALTTTAVRVPRYERKDTAKLQQSILSVKVPEKAACPYYTTRIIEKVKVAPSPAWLQARLKALGVRPLNNVIDVTNYVMLELGQPLHAFDARALPDRGIIVRYAQTGERLAALDGKTYDLTPDMLVIASSTGPVALAGIMGGEASGIQESTTSVVLEAAVFKPSQVRATSKKLGCTSESSYRFERGVDAHTTAVALDRAASLLEELAGGDVLPGRAVVGGTPKKASPIALSLERTNAMLNLSLSAAAIKAILQRDGANVTGSAKTLKVTPPTWRPDIRIEEDCIEEVARLYGYHRLTLTHMSGELRPTQLSPILQTTADVTTLLVSLGGTEQQSYPYYDRQLATTLGLPEAEHVVIENPLSRDHELLRWSMVPVLLRKAAMAARQADMVFFFETGRCFRETGRDLPEETQRVALVLAGPQAFRRLLGVLDHLVAALGIPASQSAWPTGTPLLGPGRTLQVAGKTVGSCAALSVANRDALKFRTDVAVAELALTPLAEARRTKRFAPPSAFPPVLRDLAFWLPRDLPFAAVETVLREASPLLVAHSLFDVYEEGERKSLAVHLTFQAHDRTLTAEDVEKVLARLRTELTQRCSATLREA